MSFKIWFFAFWCFKLLADFGVACAQGRAQNADGRGWRAQNFKIWRVLRPEFKIKFKNLYDLKSL
ncbi:MAG: hypothetical protein CGEMS_1518 [Candidatus Campylobacter infans]|nr:MAG: hypothetical protein CGEMS_1518 [Candidatus Campylobacter infans]